MITLPTEAPPLPDAPYRGIYSFRFIDQKIFSAREAETWALLRSILIYRGVLFYGDSGSGKSSLINAGLISAAVKENLIAHRLRIQPRRGREIKIERIPIGTDGEPPYLPSIFVEEGTKEDKELNLEISLEYFDECLAKLKDTPFDESRPLLIFDQFEEFVTLFEEVLRGGETDKAKRAQQEAPEVRMNILASLTRLMADQELPVKILFVFREEYLAKLNLLFKAAPELLAQYVRLLPPRVGEAEKIIRRPFVDEELKNRFIRDASGGGKEIPAELAKTIAAQLQQRSESGLLNLTELQIICRRLWKSPDPVEFFKEKGADIQKVLEDYWASVLRELGHLYDPAIALLGHMVTSSNTRNVISEPDLRFHEKGNFTPDQITEALKALVSSRLVRSETRYGTDIFEIASEFLVPWIQEKKSERLAQIEASKLAAETEQKFKQAETAQKLKQAARERRGLLIGATILGSLLIVAVFFALYSHYLKKVAQQAQVDLQNRTEESENLVRLMNDLTSPFEKLRLAAVQDLVALDKNGKLPRGLLRIVVAATLNDSNKEITKAASYFYDALSAESELNPIDSKITDAILKTAEEKNSELTKAQQSVKLPPRVYIQIASENQRARADKIAETLRHEGFIVRAYQLVGSRAPGQNQLRYYKSNDDAEERANAIVKDKALQKITEADGQRWFPSQLQRSSSVRPGHFEIWFASEEVSVPSPSPIAVQQVTVNLIFQDEQGKELTVTPLVSLEDVPYSRTFFVKQIKSFPVAPGDYLLFVQLKNYELYREQITLQGTVINHIVRLKSKKDPVNGEQAIKDQMP